MRIAYLGSFNPIHLGHLVQIDGFLNLLPNSLVKVDVIVSPHNPHKDPKDLLPYGLRKDLLQVSIEEHLNNTDSVFVNEIEDSLPTPNYTYITLRELTKQYGEKPIIALGTDVINQLHTWKNFEEISTYRIIECKRPGFSLNDNNYDIVGSIEAVVDISSTEIRKLMEDRKRRSLVLDQELMTPNAFKLLNRHYELMNI